MPLVVMVVVIMMVVVADVIVMVVVRKGVVVGVFGEWRVAIVGNDDQLFIVAIGAGNGSPVIFRRTTAAGFHAQIDGIVLLRACHDGR